MYKMLQLKNGKRHSNPQSVRHKANCSTVPRVPLCPGLPYPCVRPSAPPSVTRRYGIETAERRIMQITPHDSPGTVVFRC